MVRSCLLYLRSFTNFSCASYLATYVYFENIPRHKEVNLSFKSIFICTSLLHAWQMQMLENEFFVLVTSFTSSDCLMA